MIRARQTGSALLCWNCRIGREAEVRRHLEGMSALRKKRTFGVAKTTEGPANRAVHRSKVQMKIERQHGPRKLLHTTYRISPSSRTKFRFEAAKAKSLACRYAGSS